MAGTVRRAGLTLALPALVGLSTLLQWLGGRRIAGLWIMPDETIYGDRGLRFWQHGALPILHGEGAGYSVLYPIVAGLPLSFGSLERGYASLKLLQALVASLAAVPVFAYGRRVMPNGYALLAAALTVSSPLLLYSGLVMTEVLYYPLAALAVFAISRAVATASLLHQLLALAFIALAVLTRVQAVVLVAVFAAAILVEAAMARDRSRLRAFWPVWAILALIAASVALAPGVFGAYAGTFSGGYPLGGSLRLAYEHLAYIVLMVAVAPVAAAAILGVEALRGREPDRGARALIAVCTCTTILVALQVGLFAARYAPHLLGRDLAAVPPPLFAVFALWLARGAPRPFIVASAAVLGVAAVAVAAPWNDLIEVTALPDTLGIAPFLGRDGWDPATEIAVAVAIALLLVRFAPRRLTLLLPVLTVAVLTASSVSASNLVTRKVRYDQAALVGMPRDWIDRATRGPVAYVYRCDVGAANVVWQQRFWNRRIAYALGLTPWAVPGPLPNGQAIPAPDGGIAIAERYAVSGDDVAFAGTEIARQDRGADYQPLVLWKLEGPPRLSTVVSDVKPNGDILTTARVTAYGCRGGQLELTLIPKATNDVSVDLDGGTVLRAHLAGLDYWNGTVRVPRSRASDECAFTIHGGLLLGSTRIAFVRD